MAGIATIQYPAADHALGEGRVDDIDAFLTNAPTGLFL
jgi:hypothetical protein